MIYFIQAGESGPVKIGYARTRAAVRKRAYVLQVGHPEVHRLLGIVEGDRDAEAALHWFFRRFHIRGEWFRPDPGLLLIAVDVEQARNALDIAESQHRWYASGIVDLDGALTVTGVGYLMSLERTAVNEGYNLDSGRS